MGLFSRNNSTVANTTSNQYDQRQVNDAGGGVIGAGNTLDNSDRSVRLYDFSSTDGGAFDVVARVADGIADTSRIQATTAARIAAGSDAATNSAFALAMKAQGDAASFNQGAASKVFDFAQRSSALAHESSGDALGFARETFADVLGLAKSVVGQAGEQASTAAATASGAYQSAADTSTGNKTLIYAGLAVLAVAAVAFAFKR